MTTTAPTSLEGLDDPVAMLVFARTRRRDADRAEADVLAAAVAWAEQHPPESIAAAATWIAGGGDTGLPLAGPGAPLVAEFCIAEFALAVGRSTDSGRILIAHGVELKYRLPGLWSRVLSGQLTVWRARRVAERTLGLSMEAARFVDTQVAAFAHKIGPAALDRLVEEATQRFMPAQAQQNAERAADGRHVTFHHDQVSFNGTTFLEAELDLADALDLDVALTRGADQLKQCGSTQPLDVRRSMAAGEIARRQLALDLTTHKPDRTKTPPRQVVLYVHLSQAAITGTGTGTDSGSNGPLELARVENHRQVITAEQVRTWCANPETQVTVKPVIDLDEHIHVEAYEVPNRLAEQAQLRDLTCVFPWCTRPARRCDHDHATAHAHGGPTCSDNIAPLCRRHHRLKTHSGWRYTILEPGSFLWSSPHGYHFLRDHQGTLDVSPDQHHRPSSDPPHF